MGPCSACFPSPKEPICGKASILLAPLLKLPALKLAPSVSSLRYPCPVTQRSWTDFLVVAPHSSESSFLGPLSVSPCCSWCHSWRTGCPCGGPFSTASPLLHQLLVFPFHSRLHPWTSFQHLTVWPPLLIFSASASHLQQPFHPSATSTGLSTLHPALSPVARQLP